MNDNLYLALIGATQFERRRLIRDELKVFDAWLRRNVELSKPFSMIITDQFVLTHSRQTDIEVKCEDIIVHIDYKVLEMESVNGN